MLIPSGKSHAVLPFKCPSCRLDFCSQHWRPPTGHHCSEYDELKEDVSLLSGEMTRPVDCPSVGTAHPSRSPPQNRVPTCPLCSQPVSYPPNSDPNIAMDRHLSTACPVLLPDLCSNPPPKPANQCSARTCKTKMIVPIECDSCHRKFCPAHRYKSDHACGGADPAGRDSAPGGKKAFGGLFARADASRLRQPGLAGLAALRRAQQARSGPGASSARASTAAARRDPPSTNGASAPRRSPPRTATDDSDIEIVSYKPATGSGNQGKTSAAGKKALASVGVASKTDKRARAEQESQRKALEVRAKKGCVRGRGRLGARIGPRADSG